MAALVVCVVIVALPLIASSRIVRDRIAFELSSLSGYQVSMEAPPRIEVWPDFRAILTGVKLSSRDAAQSPVIHSESMEIELSAVAALRGQAVFSSVHLIRPTLRVELDATTGLYMPRPPGGGHIARSIEATRRARAEDTEVPDQGELFSGNLPALEISDGRISVFRDGKDETLVTGVAAKLDWPALTQPAALTATALWRGETVKVDLASDEPLTFLSGGAAPLSVSMTSTLGLGSFEGDAKLFDNAYFDGQASISAPSLPRLAEWLGTDMMPGASVGSASFVSRVSGDARRIKFDDVEIGLDKNLGMGVLNLSLSEKLPLLSGSLAFETLDLPSLLSAVTPLAVVVEPGKATAVSTHADLDLRLSATRAMAGSITLADVAATIQAKSGLAVFDISDGAAFGGNIQAGIRFDQKPGAATVEMRMLASGIDGGAFAAAAGMTRLVPIGRGTVSVILKGPGTSWEKMLENAKGSLSASFGQGALSGFDLAGFLKRNRQGGFFPLSEVSKGTLPIMAAEFKASVSDGVITIDKAEAKAENYTLWLSGIVPYPGGGLALSGGITPLAAPAKNETTFFVGGSWNAPFISPVVATQIVE